MKKVYNTPAVEVELYQLDASIALNCATKVTLGPAYDGYTACEDFYDDSGVWAARSASMGTSFYEEGTVCTCYYSSSGKGYFTS